MRGKIGALFHKWFKRSGDQDYEDWPQWHGFRAGYRAGLRAARNDRKERREAAEQKAHQRIFRDARKGRLQRL